MARTPNYSPTMKVNIVRLLSREFGCGSFAAVCMITHGQVYIDGHCMRMKWVEHWTGEQLQGRIIKCPAGERRIIGSRLVRDQEQMRLA